jgi:hypothetical protein
MDLWIIKWRGTWKRNDTDKVGGVLLISAETRSEAEDMARLAASPEYRITQLTSSTFRQPVKHPAILSDQRFFLMDLS